MLVMVFPDYGSQAEIVDMAHLKDIGKKYGPFDITLIDGGQYDRRWPDIHMTSEQSVQANLDVIGSTHSSFFMVGFLT